MCEFCRSWLIFILKVIIKNTHPDGMYKYKMSPFHSWYEMEIELNKTDSGCFRVNFWLSNFSTPLHQTDVRTSIYPWPQMQKLIHENEIINRMEILLSMFELNLVQMKSLLCILKLCTRRNRSNWFQLMEKSKLKMIMVSVYLQSNFRYYVKKKNNIFQSCLKIHLCTHPSYYHRNVWHLLLRQLLQW